jgi:hypothetical protein
MALARRRRVTINPTRRAFGLGISFEGITMNPQLTAAIKLRDEARAEVGAIDSRVGKLERLTQSSSPAASEKAALHSDHELSLKAWVASGDADAPPALDADRLARLDAEIRAHESSKASANDGIAALIRARDPILVRVRAAESALHFVAVETLVADVLPELLNRYNEAHAQAVATRGQLESLHGFIVSEAEKRRNSGGDNGLFGVASRMWDEARTKTVAPPIIINHSDFSAKLDAILNPKKDA